MGATTRLCSAERGVVAVAVRPLGQRTPHAEARGMALHIIAEHQWSISCEVSTNGFLRSYQTDRQLYNCYVNYCILE